MVSGALFGCFPLHHRYFFVIFGENCNKKINLLLIFIFLFVTMTVFTNSVTPQFNIG